MASRLQKFILFICIVRVVPAAANEPGLLFHASFDGTVDAWSLSGRGEPAQIIGKEPQFAPGRADGQAFISGHSETLVHYPTAGNLLAESGTVSLWVQPVNWSPDDGHFHSFFESGSDSGQTGWLILYKYFEHGWLLLRYADERRNVGLARHADFHWEPGQWQHLAATWARNELQLFVNGEPVAKAPQPLVAATLGTTFCIGDNGWHLPREDARTLIDDVRIYAYPLPEERIRILAGAGRLDITRSQQPGRWLVSAEMTGMQDAEAVNVWLTAADSDERLIETAGELQAFRAKAEIDVSDLAPGTYRAGMDVFGADGRLVHRVTGEIERRAEEWLELANEHISLRFDRLNGALLAVEHPASGRSYRTDTVASPLFTAQSYSFSRHARFFTDDDLTGLPASDESLRSIDVKRENGRQVLTAEYAFEPGILAVFTAVLPDDAAVVTMHLRIENPRPVRPSEAVRIPHVVFPKITGLRCGENTADDLLATGRIHGEIIARPAEQAATSRSTEYPGRACVPWQSLYDDQGGIFMLPLTDGRCQLDIQAEWGNGVVGMGSRWWTVMEPGDVWESPAVEIGLHDGAWHAVAERFREWSLVNTPPRAVPEWLDTCDGWFGMGWPGYKFAELPQMLEVAQYYGLSYLQLWGQMILGRAYYSYFSPNPDLGTEDDLRAGIAAVHQAGGKVGFYSNAITFDAAVDDNATLQEKIAEYGLEGRIPPLPSFYDEAYKSVFVSHQGQYGFSQPSGHSTYAYLDGYWAMDPGARWWQDYLAGWISKWHDDYGADIWYLDSFPVHGYGIRQASYAIHQERPRSTGDAQLELLARIRERFDGPLLYEGVVCAALMPYTEWVLGTELSFGGGVNSHPEIWAYSFGDVHPVFSGTANTWRGIGQIWPDLEEPRQEDAMNLVFLNGHRFDMLGPYPLNRENAYGEHMRKLIALRAKVRDIVYKGRMMDSLGLAGMPERVEARVFVRQEPAGAVVTVADRRGDERAPWELVITPQAGDWPNGLTHCRLLQLDGTEQDLAVTAAGGTVRIRMDEPQEVSALHFSGG